MIGGWHVDEAAAAVTATCGTSSSTLDISVSGGSASDVLVVTTASGFYSITLDGSAVSGCSSISDSSNPTVAVTITQGSVSTTFQPGSDSGVTFEGASGASNTLDLSGESTSSSSPLQVNVSGTSVGSQANDTAVVGATTYAFSGISTFVGSASGNTTFMAGAASMTFTGEGPGNELDFSHLSTSSPLQVNVSGTSARGQANDTAVVGATTYAFSGISTFVGSASGNTTFMAGAASMTFTGLVRQLQVLVDRLLDHSDARAVWL